MREILFRGKRVGDGKWVYGNYFWPDKPQIQERHHDYDHNYYHYWDIDLDTLSQYTGLRDKNCVRIFEGDIVKQYNAKGDIQEGIVQYESNYCSFVIIHNDNTDLFSHISNLEECAKIIGDNVGCEIIGNYYDNNGKRKRKINV